MTRRHVLSVLGGAAAEVFAQEPQPRIAIWYGPRQRFGRLGRPQRWVNLLGSVSPAGRIARLEFSINGGEWRRLSIGPNLERLASPGDFNAELAWEELDEGLNRVVFRAANRDGLWTEAAVEVECFPGTRWPLPYRVDWPDVQSIQDAVQVVDGRWQLRPEGVRTLDPYYDRVVAIGDMNWADYWVSADVTFHGFPGPKPGPPQFNVNHAGIGLRWRGHADDGRQPRTQWYP
jgi:hypothetical protein